MARVVYLCPWGRDEWALRRPGELQPFSVHRSRRDAHESGRALALRGWRYLDHQPDPSEPEPPTPVPVQGPG